MVSLFILNDYFGYFVNIIYMLIFTSVSYTHLDVYKRQTIHQQTNWKNTPQIQKAGCRVAYKTTNKTEHTLSKHKMCIRDSL